MSYYPDMGTKTQIDEGSHIRAVGWLSGKRSFTQGEVSPEVMARIKEFATRWGEGIMALGWGVFMGLHECELCHDFMASGNFGVPCGELLFVAPEMLPHYVEAHDYRPPDEFVAAVMQSPLPGTEEYRAMAEPFRRLHWQLHERRNQEAIKKAARYAAKLGGDERALRWAESRFFGMSNSPEVRERIRQVMEGS
jgi:hypothetical protein